MISRSSQKITGSTRAILQRAAKRMRFSSMVGQLPETLPRAELERLRCERLTALVQAILPSNEFYARKFAAAGLTAEDVRTPTDLKRLPFTTKAELVADQAANLPYGSNLTY